METLKLFSHFTKFVYYSSDEEGKNWVKKIIQMNCEGRKKSSKSRGNFFYEVNEKSWHSLVLWMNSFNIQFDLWWFSPLFTFLSDNNDQSFHFIFHRTFLRRHLFHQHPISPRRAQIEIFCRSFPFLSSIHFLLHII